MAKKLAMGWKLAAGAGTLVAAPGAAYAVGEAAELPAGWKRAAVGFLTTGVLAGLLAMFKPTRDAALWAAIGGAVGSAALFAQPAAQRWMARRKADREAKKALADAEAQQRNGAQYDAFSHQAPAPLPPPQPAPIIIQQPAKAHKPTTIEQLTPVFTTLISSGLEFAGVAVKGGGATFRGRAMAVNGSGAAFKGRGVSLYALQNQ